MRIIIFAEGGGNRTRSQNRLQGAMQAFLRHAISSTVSSKLNLQNVDVKCQGNVLETLEKFRNYPNEPVDVFGDGEFAITLLLIDADAYVEIGKEVEHINKCHPGKKEMHWAPLSSNISAQRVCLMVQEMETWFLASPKSVKSHYQENDMSLNIPKGVPLESVGKLPICQCNDVPRSENLVLMPTAYEKPSKIIIAGAAGADNVYGKIEDAEAILQLLAKLSKEDVEEIMKKVPHLEELVKRVVKFLNS